MQPEMKLYNTQTRQLETFESLQPPNVKMYVCGPTVYDDAHLGHARCYITWDVLYRFLTFMGYEVTYARNITDVDDKIINRARENNESPQALAERYTERFHAVMKKLNVLSPNTEPKATAYIDKMIAVIQALIQKEYAYQTLSGTVYFSIEKKENYGELCQQSLNDLLSGARVEVDPEKRSPLDFALWKPAPQAELGWDSPWGWGRPGWHIECSAMSHEILGDQLDIHAGGMDLIFPHHQNEIAQSESFTGKTPFVRYWMHNGFVNVSGEKMSKSLGNFSTVEKLLEIYDTNTLRYFILSHHYRSPMDFNDEALEGAKNRIQKIKDQLKRFPNELNTQRWLERGRTYIQSNLQTDPLLQKWLEAMRSDLNTPQAVSVLDELFKEMFVREEALASFFALSDVMGFDFLTLQTDIEIDHLQPELSRLALELAAPVSPSGMTAADLIDALIRLRENVRSQKNWAISDQIRDKMAALGIKLEDKKDKTTSWIYEAVRSTASA
jgi:cysteinyl-tRNA synthetase